MNLTDNPIYHERLTSNRTEFLFLALTLLFLLLLIWRVSARSLDLLAVLFLLFFILFLFYSLNYRVLVIRLTADSLKLTFGLITWTVALDNIAERSLDDLPALKRLGGAGIHFMTVRTRYRASFNFLEYPRLVIALKKKAGPVQDISFSTRRPDTLLRLIQESPRPSGQHEL